MRTYVQAVAFAEGQRLHPTTNWTFKCQSFARQCVGAEAWATSALQAWNDIPASHKHTGAPPAGALVYFGDSWPGHAVFSVGNGYCYSTDILRNSMVDRVPLSLITSKWGLRQLGWIDWTPSGAINMAPAAPRVYLSHIQAAAKLDPPAAQGHTTYPREVILAEQTLTKLGFLGSNWVDGSWGTKTTEAYQRFQASIKVKPTALPQLADLQALGRRGGFYVVG